MSSVKMARPVTFAGASLRGTLRPTTCVGLEIVAGVGLRWGIAFELAPAPDRVDDPGVARAAAEVAAERGLDVVVGGIRVAIDERLGRHHHARCAVAALDGALGDERLLQRVHGAVRCQPLDGRYLAAVGGDRQHQTRLHRLAVEEDRAGAAVAEVAAPLGTGEPEVVAQQLEKGDVGSHRNAVGIAVDREMNYSLHQTPCGSLLRFRSRCSILDARYSILDARRSVLDTRCRMLDAGCSMLDAGWKSRIRNSKRKTQNS